MLHPGEAAVQRRTGLPGDDRGSVAVGATIPPVAADFLRQRRMVVTAVAADDGRVWAGLLTGPAGFAEATNERTVVVDRLPAPGDPLHGLFDTDREIGMIAMEFAPRARRMRINGWARAHGRRLVVRTDQVFSNCPKYIQARHVVDEPSVWPDPFGPSSGSPSGSPSGGSTECLTEAQQRWIASADTFYVASHAPGHGVDASHRGGNPGFVSVVGPRRLVWPDYVGNTMYMTLGNIDVAPACGLLFLDWERGAALHLTGRARIDWDSDRAAGVPGARRMVDFDIDAVLPVDRATPLRWVLDGYFRHNPPVLGEGTGGVSNGVPGGAPGRQGMRGA